MAYLPDDTAPTGYLPTTAGSIPYVVMWNAKESYYGESAGEKTPTTITVKIRVNWEDSTLFTEFARGYAFYSGAGNVGRKLPLKCPFDFELYCSNLEFSKLGKDGSPDPVANWPTAAWIEYTATFSVRPYDLQTDAYVTALGAGGELGRYVTRKRRYNYKERRINPGQLLFSDNTPCMVPSFVPFNGGEMEYLWHMVPSNCVDFAFIDATLGKCNSSVFDPAAFYGERNIGGPFAAETMLFVGFTNQWPTFPMSNGKLAYDIPFLFRYNPLGWNKFPKSDGTFDTCHIRGTASTKLYPTADLSLLFQARI